jgi:cytochrome c
MPDTLLYYAKLLILLVALTLLVGFNFAVWGLHRHPKEPTWYVPGANPERGRVLIKEYGCGACHTISGVRGAVGQVGPRLDGLKSQMFVGGVLPNTPQNLVDWIQSPRQANPRTAMPDLGVGAQDARDIAGYLYSTR